MTLQHSNWTLFVETVKMVNVRSKQEGIDFCWKSPWMIWWCCMQESPTHQQQLMQIHYFILSALAAWRLFLEASAFWILISDEFNYELQGLNEKTFKLLVKISAGSFLINCHSYGRYFPDTEWCLHRAKASLSIIIYNLLFQEQKLDDHNNRDRCKNSH